MGEFFGFLVRVLGRREEEREGGVERGRGVYCLLENNLILFFEGVG